VGGGWRGDFGGTCSGQRGYGLERELRFKTSRGMIDYRTASASTRDRPAAVEGAA